MPKPAEEKEVAGVQWPKDAKGVRSSTGVNKKACPPSVLLVDNASKRSP